MPDMKIHDNGLIEFTRTAEENQFILMEKENKRLKEELKSLKSDMEEIKKLLKGGS